MVARGHIHGARHFTELHPLGLPLVLLLLSVATPGPARAIADHTTTKCEIAPSRCCYSVEDCNAVMKNENDVFGTGYMMTAATCRSEWPDCTLPPRGKNLFRTGVLAIRGKDAAMSEYGPTFTQWLTEHMTTEGFEERFEIAPMNFDETNGYASRREIDFIYTNPSVFSCVEAEFGARVILSMLNNRSNKATGESFELDQFGGTIFARSDNDAIQTLDDIRGKRVSAVSILGLGAARLQWEHLKDRGIELMVDPSAVVFTKNQKKIVWDVIRGYTEVGFVRTDLSERMVGDVKTLHYYDDFGNITRSETVTFDLGMIKVLEPTVPADFPNFPFPTTTKLVPEWPMAMLPWVTNDVAQKVSDAMTLVMPESYAAKAGKYAKWVPPLSYLPLYTQLQKLQWIDETGICLKDGDLYESVVCPARHYKITRELFARSCDSVLKCPPQFDLDDPKGPVYECVCSPCIALPEQLVKALPTNTRNAIEGPAVEGDAVPSCAPLAPCATGEQREVMSFRVVDVLHDARDQFGEAQYGTITYRIGGPQQGVSGEDATTVGFTEGRNLGGGEFVVDLSISETGRHMVEVKLDGQNTEFSPFFIDIVKRDCTTVATVRHVADDTGICVCPAPFVEDLASGSCVCPDGNHETLQEGGAITCTPNSTSMGVGPIIGIVCGVVLFVGALLASVVYYMKRRSERMWRIPYEEVQLSDPVQVLGRGTFGLVVRGEFRGTTVAIKRVLPPTHNTRHAHLDDNDDDEDGGDGIAADGVGIEVDDDVADRQDSDTNLGYQSGKSGLMHTITENIVKNDGREAARSAPLLGGLIDVQSNAASSMATGSTAMQVEFGSDPRQRKESQAQEAAQFMTKNSTIGGGSKSNNAFLIAPRVGAKVANQKAEIENQRDAFKRMHSTASSGPSSKPLLANDNTVDFRLPLPSPALSSSIGGEGLSTSSAAYNRRKSNLSLASKHSTVGATQEITRARTGSFRMTHSSRLSQVISGALSRGATRELNNVREARREEEAALKMRQKPTRAQARQWSKLRKEFVTEMKLVVHLRHPNITTIMGAVMDRRSEPLLVMECMERGSLYDLLHNETVWLDQHIVVGILKDVVAGMKYLHASGIMHCDLKAANVLVDEKFRAKVSDFGLSQKLKSGMMSSNKVVGSPYWMAPELLLGKSEPTIATDVYAFGIMLYEIFSRRDPFEGENASEVLRGVIDPVLNKRPVLPPQVPEKIKHLIEACWNTSSDSRPSFDDILSELDEIPVQDLTSAFVNQVGEAAKHTEVLLNMFPPAVLEALKEGRPVEPQSHECVTIFFSDIVGYTSLSSGMTAEEVTDMLDRLYEAFDALCSKHNLFKVDTIGDAYMCVANLIEKQPDHSVRMARFAVEAIKAANATLVKKSDPDGPVIHIRAGFHAGPVVAAVTGTVRPKFTLFGDTVNTASRMESSGVKDRAQLSEACALMLKEQAPDFPLRRRGEIPIKGKGAMTTYWVADPVLEHILTERNLIAQSQAAKEEQAKAKASGDANAGPSVYSSMGHASLGKTVKKLMKDVTKGAPAQSGARPSGSSIEKPARSNSFGA